MEFIPGKFSAVISLCGWWEMSFQGQFYGPVTSVSVPVPTFGRPYAWSHRLEILDKFGQETLHCQFPLGSSNHVASPEGSNVRGCPGTLELYWSCSFSIWVMSTHHLFYILYVSRCTYLPIWNISFYKLILNVTSRANGFIILSSGIPRQKSHIITA